MASSAATSAPRANGGPSAGGDEIDDLFDYDIGGEDDPFSANYKLPAAQAPAKAKDSSSSWRLAANLGIDEEIEVTRKPRAPRVKLDEHRLLSANGIPKLRSKAKAHLKLKGKGHEYTDASRLLAFYQLWLDDLFPKARFLDALAMVEKMGHKRMMQTARMDWINEGKPKSSEQEDTLYDDPIVPTRENADRQENTSRIAPIFEKAATARPKTPVDDNLDADDLYDASPKPRAAAPVPVINSLFGEGTASIFGPKQNPINLDGDLPDDELDALLAEEEALQTASGNRQPAVSAPKATMVEDDFDDEMEAMAEMEGMW